MIIRPMAPGEEEIVRDLCAQIDGGKAIADRPEGWHLEHPTLVAVIDGQIAGYTTYHIDEANRVMVLTETAVAEAHRGVGIARALMARRLAIAAELDIAVVVGGAKDDNAPMRHLLDAFGFTAQSRDAGTDIMFYTKVL